MRCPDDRLPSPIELRAEDRRKLLRLRLWLRLWLRLRLRLRLWLRLRMLLQLQLKRRVDDVGCRCIVIHRRGNKLRVVRADHLAGGRSVEQLLLYVQTSTHTIRKAGKQTPNLTPRPPDTHSLPYM